MRSFMGGFTGSLILCVTGCVSPAPQDGGPEVFNAHMHSAYLSMNDAEYHAQVLAEMDANNIRQAVLHISEPSDIGDWGEKAPNRFLLSPSFPCFDSGRNGERSCAWDQGDWPSVTWLRTQYENGSLSVMGELMYVYAAISPTGPEMAPYWALAAELDIPVAVHINRGPPPESPSRPAGCCPNFNAELGNPELLRPILKRYPELRLYLQHAGFPSAQEMGGFGFAEETFAVLSDYPNVYVDMTALNSVPPAFVHEAAVREFLKRGFIDRIMMGTDNWPAEPIVSRYSGFDFLNEKELRGILYDNASRFFRLETTR